MYKENSNLRPESINLAWKMSAFFIGGGLPLILFGKAVLATWFSIGLLFGVIAMMSEFPKFEEIKNVFFSNIAKATLIVLLVFSASALNSVDQHYSLVRFYEMFYLSLASGILVLVLNKMPKEYVYLLFKILSLTTLVIALIVLVDSFTNYERFSFAIHGDRWAEIDRLEKMSSILAILAPFVWTWLFKLARHDHFWAKKSGLIISYLVFFSVVVCGGVAGWVAGFCGAIVYLVVGGKWHGLALNTKHWFLLPCAVFVAFLGYFAASGIENLQDSAFLNKYSEHTTFAKKSLDYLADTPILGVGVNATRYLPTPDAIIGKSSDQNFLLQLLIETGFFGLSAVIILISMVLYRLYRYAMVNAYGLAGVSSMVAFFVASLANTSIFNAWWLAFFIALSSLSIRMCKN